MKMIRKINEQVSDLVTQRARAAEPNSTVGIGTVMEWARD